MPNDREFRLPKSLLAVLAVNAGVALAAYGVTAPVFMSSSAPDQPAPVFATSPPSDDVEPARDEVASAPGPSQVGRDPFAGAPEPADAGARDPCGKCGMG